MPQHATPGEAVSAELAELPSREGARVAPPERAGRAGGSGGGTAPAPLLIRTPVPGSCLGDVYSATAAAIQAPQMPKTTASNVTHCASVQAAAGACTYSAATPCAGLSQPPCSSGGCSRASDAAPAGAESADAAAGASPAAGEPFAGRLGLRPMLAATQADAWRAPRCNSAEHSERLLSTRTRSARWRDRSRTPACGTSHARARALALTMRGSLLRGRCYA